MDANGRERGSIATFKSNAVDTNPDGSATIVAAQFVKTPTFAYFVSPTNAAPQNLNQPLSWQGITVIRVAAGGTFNLGTWPAAAGKNYKINVSNGRLAVEGNNDFY